jgi:hypothetical protein
METVTLTRGHWVAALENWTQNTGRKRLPDYASGSRA